MQFHFDRLYDRENTGSLKWDHRREIFGTDEILPMWVADSDWPTAPPVIEALKAEAEEGIIGYKRPSAELDRIVVDWIARRYGWEIVPEWVVYTSGIVPSLKVAVRAFTRPGDHVIVQPPIYQPFFSVVRSNGAHVAENELLYTSDGYRMDYTGLEAMLKEREKRIPLLILCSPHNPVGRVWTRRELVRLSEICAEHGTTVISDEIHADLIYPPSSQVPYSSLDSRTRDTSITMFSPGKTFNIAGLQIAVLVIPSPELRKQFKISREHLLTRGNNMGLAAMEAAYRDCDQWVEAQNDYLNENRRLAVDFFRNRIPEINPIKPEGTFLLWLDCRQTGLKHRELCTFMKERAHVGLNSGTWFGSGGRGFMRLNFACPQKRLIQGLKRIEAAAGSL